MGQVTATCEEVTSMSKMFYRCFNLTSIDLSNFDTSKVTDMSLMIGECHILTSVDLSGFNTFKVDSMMGMFAICDKLTTLDLSSFDTSNVTDMAYMFSDCTMLTTIKGIIDMKSCYYYDHYENMFYNCSKLKGVKIKNPPDDFDGAGLSSSQYTIVS